MAVVNEARAVLTADDRASHVLAMVARNFDRLNRAADRVNAHVGNPRAQQKMQEATARTSVLTAGMGAAAMRAAGPLAGLLTVYGAGSGAFRANKVFADNERSMTRIAVTADASAEAQATAWTQLQALARETAQPVAKVREGLDALVASGRSLPEAMAFLPAVAQTAQASGAEVSDIAKTADAVGESFKISGDKMQNAFDIMAAGGKAGKFELKDMARYLPSLGPATAALGFKGEKGLADLVALLQTMRKGTGTAEEAVASMSNILNKMESDKTTKEFKKLGVDSEEAFKKARKEGRNLVEVFEELLQKATKGDASKIGEIIDDQEFKRGAVALMQFKGEWQKLSQTMQTSSAGTVAADLARVTANSQATFDRFKNSAERLADTLGKRLAPAFKAAADASAGMMDGVTGALSPGEDDLARRKRLNLPLTPAQQAAEALRRERENQDKPAGSGWRSERAQAAGLAAARAREGILRNKRDRSPDEEIEFREARLEIDRQRRAVLEVMAKRNKAQDKELDALKPRIAEAEEQQSWRRQQKEQAEREALQTARARFLKGERDEADVVGSASQGRSGAHGDVDYSKGIYRETNARADKVAGELAVAGMGSAGEALRQAFFNLATTEARRPQLTQTAGASVAGEISDRAQSVMYKAIAGYLAKDGQPANREQVVEAYRQFAEAAKTLVAKVEPGQRIDGAGLPGSGDGFARVLSGLKVDVKPDQITANANVAVTGDVQIRIEPTTDFRAWIDKKLMSFRQTDTRGISLPGKETRPGGGGGGGAM